MKPGIQDEAEDTSRMEIVSWSRNTGKAWISLKDMRQKTQASHTDEDCQHGLLLRYR